MYSKHILLYDQRLELKPISWQRGWKYIISRAASNPNHSVVITRTKKPSKKKNQNKTTNNTIKKQTKNPRKGHQTFFYVCSYPAVGKETGQASRKQILRSSCCPQAFLVHFLIISGPCYLVCKITA